MAFIPMHFAEHGSKSCLVLATFSTVSVWHLTSHTRHSLCDTCACMI